MAPERSAIVKQLLAAALNVASTEREAYLDRACAGDPELREDLLRLLRESDDTVEFRQFTLAPGDLIASRYRIVRMIGRGGMGEVYEALDGLLNETVALKTLRADYANSDTVVKRFQR